MLSPHRTAGAYRDALRLAELATKEIPDDAAVLNTLGVAQLRAMRFDEALATLQQADELNREQQAYNRAGDLLFLAMCLHELGRGSEARSSLDEARGLFEPEADPELAALLAEAEALLGG